MGKIESCVESALIAIVSNNNGLCRKYTSTSHVNVPDRIVFLQNEIWFVELKAIGKKPSKGQYRELCKMKNLGCNVGWLAGLNGVLQFERLVINNTVQATNAYVFDGLRLSLNFENFN